MTTEQRSELRRRSVLSLGDPGVSVGLDPETVLSLLDAIDAGERFKAFAHSYLDAHGVPHGDPDNPHQKEGCRIGARLDLLFAQRDAAESRLGNLLARIHGDGGHWQDAHGTEKAVADAERVWAALQTRADEVGAAERREAGLREALKQIAVRDNLLGIRDAPFGAVVDQWAACCDIAKAALAASPPQPTTDPDEAHSVRP